MPPEHNSPAGHDQSKPLLSGREDLKHKILSISEREGVRDASYQLKLFKVKGTYHSSLPAKNREQVARRGAP